MRNGLFWGVGSSYTYGVSIGKQKGDNILMDELKEREAQELSKEEIDVYKADCGEIQNHCKKDCFGGGSFLNPDY